MRWGGVAKDGFLKKQRKYRPRIAQNLSEGIEVGCICKGGAESQGGVEMQRPPPKRKGGVNLQRTFVSVARCGQNAKTL